MIGLALSVLLVVAVPAVPALAGSDEADVSVFISEEVTTGTASCSTGTVAVRTAVDVQRDPWLTAASGQGRSVVGAVHIPVPSDPNRVDHHPTTMTFPELVVGGAPLSMAVSLRNVAPSSIPAYGGAAGDPDVGALPTGSTFRAPYTPVPSNGTLQDCAPYPQSFHATHPDNSTHARQWNEVGGSSALLNAVLFDFDTPVGAFGAWFGDLETRPETPAWYKLLGTDGSVVDEGPIPTSTVDPSDLNCGLGQPGCGNRSTRWVGFTSDQPVASVLVVVGDDDSCEQLGPAQCAGLTEHISWIGATVAMRPPALQVTKTATSTSVGPGEPVEWEVVVANTGEVDLTGVEVEDLPGEMAEVAEVAGDGWDCAVGPPTSCRLERLPPGAGSVIRVVTLVAADVTAEEVGNVVNVTGDGVVAAADAAVVTVDLPPAEPNEPSEPSEPSEEPPVGPPPSAPDDVGDDRQPVTQPAHPPAGPAPVGPRPVAASSGVDAAPVAAREATTAAAARPDRLARTGGSADSQLWLGGLLGLLGVVVLSCGWAVDRWRLGRVVGRVQTTRSR